MRRLFALTLILLAPALRAETYKWVDERGVVNYSNTPPPSAAKAGARQVANRVSTYESDPGFRQAAAASIPTPYEGMLHQEWMQRQRLMAESQNLDKVVAATPPAESYYYPAGFYSGGYYRGASRGHNRSFLRVSHHRNNNRR